MNDEATQVTDELGSVKRLNNRPKILALLGVGLMLLIVLFGFSQLEKRNNAVVASDDEAENVGSPAERPLEMRDTAVDGVIPAQDPSDRPIPTGALDTSNVPVTIPDAQGNTGRLRLAGPSAEETEQEAAHRAALRQVDMDAELDRKKYFIQLSLEREREARDTNKLAASSPMNITLGAAKSGDLLGGQSGAMFSGFPGGDQLSAGLGQVGAAFSNPAGAQSGFDQPFGLPGTPNPQEDLLAALTSGGAGGQVSVEDANRQSDKRAFADTVDEDESSKAR